MSGHGHNPYQDPNYRPTRRTAPFPRTAVPAQNFGGPGPSYTPYVPYPPPPIPPSHHVPAGFGYAAAPQFPFAPGPQVYDAPTPQIDPALLAGEPDSPLVALAELPSVDDTHGAGGAAAGDDDPFQDDIAGNGAASSSGSSGGGGGSEDEYYHPGEITSEDEDEELLARQPSSSPDLASSPDAGPSSRRRGKGRPKGQSTSAKGKAKGTTANPTSNNQGSSRARGRSKKTVAAPIVDDEETGSEGEADDDVDDDDDGDEEEEDGQLLSRLAGFVSRRSAPGQSTAEGGTSGRDLFNDEIESVVVEEIRGRGKGKGKSRRVRKGHEPNYETKQLLGEANMDFMIDRVDEALEKFLEVIRLDPQVHEAWVSLATCYDAKKMGEAALQMRFCAAHIESDEETWRELATSFKEKGQDTQALYCLRKALRSDPNDLMMLMDMVEINRNLGKASRAVESFKKILKIDSVSSRDFTLLAEYYSLFKDTNQGAYFSQVLRAAFDYHMEVYAGPTNELGNTMQVEHIVLLVDLLLASERLEEALMVVRRGQRWMQGRKDERTWDAYDDDREFDPPGTARMENEENEADDAEGHPLDFALRHRLALIRLRLGNDSEAAIHIEEFLQLDVLQHSHLFIALADELFQRKLWDQALNCYAAVQECSAIPDDPDMIYHVGICHHQIKELKEAAEALRWVAEKDPGNLEARLRLATVLEEQGHKAEALDIVSDVLRDRAKDPTAHSRRSRASATNADGSRQSKAELASARRLQKKVLEDQMLARMQGLWADAQAAEQGIGEGEAGALDRFIYAAGTMIETFRLAKGNFKKDRGVTRIPVPKGRKNRKHDIDSEAAELHDRLERVMGIEDETPLDEDGDRYIVVRQNQFYEIGAEDWLSLIVKYCCVLMVKQEEDVAMDILEHVLWAGLFNNRRCEIAIRLTTVACAMRMRLYDKVIENCKRLIQMHQFRIEPLLLMNAALGSGGTKAQKQYRDKTLQRFIHRELRIFEQAVRGIRLRWNGVTLRYNEITKVGWSRKLGDVSSGEEDGDGDEDGSVAPSRARAKGGRKSASQRQEEEDEEDEEDDDGRYGPTRDSGDEEGLPAAPPLPKPTLTSPNFNAVYGQLMLTNAAYQTALVYYLRAYEVDPYNPLVCLGIAQAFFGRSFNRQVDNRNYMIAQGMAFLTRYRKLSPKYQEAQEEVEYNYGRAFHGIGVPHLAIVHYERVLDSVQSRMDVSPDPASVRSLSLALEAAHNLMQLYAASGSNQLVKVRSAWLAI